VHAETTNTTERLIWTQPSLLSRLLAAHFLFVLADCSEEVVWRAKARVGQDLLLSGCWIELEEVILHEFVDLHNGCFVAAAVAVVRCREDCDDVALVRPVVPIHDQLMRASDTRQVV